MKSSITDVDSCSKRMEKSPEHLSRNHRCQQNWIDSNICQICPAECGGEMKDISRKKCADTEQQQILLENNETGSVSYCVDNIYKTTKDCCNEDNNDEAKSDFYYEDEVMIGQYESNNNAVSITQALPTIVSNTPASPTIISITPASPTIVEIPITDNYVMNETNECPILTDQILVNRETCLEISRENNNGELLEKCVSCSFHPDSEDCSKNNVKSPTKLCDSVSLSEPCCRVCQCNDEEEKLISPCFCSGSVKWMHESCLIKWMKSSYKDSCELCRQHIDIAKRRKPISKWKLPSQRPTPVLWVLVFVTAIALNLASVVKDASRLCSSTPCLVFYAVGCIGVILGTLFLIYWSKRAKNFIYHWVELNEEWVVITGNKDKRDEHGEQEKKSKEVVRNDVTQEV